MAIEDSTRALVIRDQDGDKLSLYARDAADPEGVVLVAQSTDAETGEEAAVYVDRHALCLILDYLRSCESVLGLTPSA